MTPILAFDIETVPDVAGIRLLHDLPKSVSDADVVAFAQQKRRAQTGGFYAAPSAPSGGDFLLHALGAG